MQLLVPRTEKDHEIFKGLPKRRRILILGSTGSIGKSVLSIIEQFPEELELLGIVAQGNNPQSFAEQIRKYGPKYAVVTNADTQQAIETLSSKKIEVGQDRVLELCRSSEVDIVLAAIVGAAGLSPVIAALGASKIIALANKESLVVGGEVVRKLCTSYGPRILPVDSEHCGLFQCLMGHKAPDISSLTLTASGGPFLRKSLSELSSITSEEAIKHPRWKMGPKISVDSATLMNKALELIEAHYLYGLPAQNLSAVIHPQSLVHAIVNFVDGSSLLHASHPDMKEPIAFALNYPRNRLPKILPKLELGQIRTLEFEEVDSSRFPAIPLALNCIQSGSQACISLNEANEVAVAQFLAGRLRFVDILPFIQEVLSMNISSTIEHFSEKCCELDVYNLQTEVRRHCDFVLQRFKVG